jgi:hypothetical protein
MQLSQATKIVGCYAPKDINGGAITGDIVGMQEYNHITFLVYVGNLAGNSTLTVEKCTDNTGSGNAAIGFSYRLASAGAAGGSELDGALTAVGVGGYQFLAASDDNKIMAVELDAVDIAAPTTPYVRCCMSDPSAAGLISIVAIMSEPRYLKDVPPSAVD